MMVSMQWVAVGCALLLTLTVCRGERCARARSNERPVWTWECQSGVCEKLAARDDVEPTGLDMCKALCDPHAMLWPLPRGAGSSFGKELVPLDMSRVTVVSPKVTGPAKTLLAKAITRFDGILADLARQVAVSEGKGGNRLQIEITIDMQNTVRMEIGTPEGYSLHIKQITEGELVATISAQTFFGARHALETLTQLVVPDSVNSELTIFRDASIVDSPAFTHRSLNLDTARNYFSVASIKRTIEGLAMNKLNTLHWHITDSHSWPFVSESTPQLSQYGAYSPSQVYRPSDVREIVEYGRVRGVRVIPEIDAPAHVGEGWQWTEEGTVVCSKAQPWTDYCVEPPCGQLNPGAEQVYDILGNVYGDVLRLFDSDVFHMGGDEVNINCWNTSLPVIKAMEEKGFNRTKSGFLDLWDVFQKRAYEKVVEANGNRRMPIILWTSGLTESGEVDKYLDKETYIIQIWTKGDDPIIAELLEKGYRLIFSNYDALYLDCGFAGWVTGGNNWCSPYIGWQTVYSNDLYGLLAAQNITSRAAQGLVLGAEAALWSEQADESTLDGKLWPRLQALAERLWANPTTDWRTAESRMLNQRERMQDRGFHPNSLQPEWCHQNQGYCPILV